MIDEKLWPDGNLDDYQSLAASTAVYPRVYTEDQVRKMLLRALDVYPSDEESDQEFATYLLLEYETEFSRMVYPVLGLVGEAGEVANKLKKVARDEGGQWTPDKTQDYEKETGDVLWYLAAIATGMKSSLQLIGQNNIKKLYDRKARGVLGGSGDDR